VEVRQRLLELMRSFGRAPSEESVAAFHTSMVGTAILHAARNDPRSRKESAALAALAVATSLAGGASVEHSKSTRARMIRPGKGE